MMRGTKVQRAESVSLSVSLSVLCLKCFSGVAHRDESVGTVRTRFPITLYNLFFPLRCCVRMLLAVWISSTPAHHTHLHTHAYTTCVYILFSSFNFYYYVLSYLVFLLFVYMYRERESESARFSRYVRAARIALHLVRRPFLFRNCRFCSRSPRFSAAGPASPSFLLLLVRLVFLIVLLRFAFEVASSLSVVVDAPCPFRIPNVDTRHPFENI